MVAKYTLKQDWRYWCTGLGIGSLLIASLQDCVFAQITPDNTLPNNSSVIRDSNTFNINEGTQAGRNLFHSFSEFSVPSGGTVFFNNAVDIQNIISRVTGSSSSNIDGIIRASGTANLFLINPNGIIFGRGARLDIGGSFVGTTSDEIGFGNQGFFSASNPQSSSSLLSVNPSALLFNQIKTESIQNNSVGLRVPDGKSLLLVGGDINMDGGGLYAFGGRVELGGLASAGTVGLNGDGNNLSLSFPGHVERSNVSLSNNAQVSVASGGGGSIAINAKNINILDRSSLRAGIRLFAKANNVQAGDVTLNAKETVRIENSFIYNAVFGLGNGGSLSVDTGKLIIQDGIVATGTISSGNAGPLIIKASDSIELTGSSSSNGTINIDIDFPINLFGHSLNLTIPFTVPIGLFSASIDAEPLFPENFRLRNLLISSLPTASGNAGHMTIETGRLIVSNGAVISAATMTKGEGGDLTVKADWIELSGTSANDNPLSLFSTTEKLPSALRNDTNGLGSGGNLTIETRRLIIRDGAWVMTGIGSQNPGEELTVTGGELIINATDSVELVGTSQQGMSASQIKTLIGFFGGALVSNFIEDHPFPSGIITGTAGNGKGSDLTINTGRLSIQDGAQASVSTFGAGEGGSLTVSASSIDLKGILQQNLELNDEIMDQSLLTSAVAPGSTGKGGDIKLETDSLTVTNKAKVTVSNLSSLGNAGNLDIEANVIRLENQGELKATTEAGIGGNITLSDLNLLLMRDRSLISAEALNDANGGNITINAKDGFIVAVPGENSDIVANASRGNGGKINITTSGIYGLENRSQKPRDPDRSEINASSDFGTDGTVELNTPEIDPNSGLLELLTIPVDTEVAQGCYSPGYAQSSFVNIGRGGLPPNPKDILTTDTTQIDWVSLQPSNNKRPLPPVTVKPTTSTPKRIVEATGATLNAKGQIVLSANSSNVTSYTSRQNSIQCHGS